ncbi:MAG TPA: Mur ligase family protein [Candidatus Saccharimonadales bacterium]|nr:Mur ligase family protein [Candidatus Saccharimonadales bacterium]
MSPNKLTSKISAHAAALRHGMPGKKLHVIGVYGVDGADVTIAALTEILKTSGERVGVISADYVEIANERASGSDQAQPIEDAFRLQELLAQIKRAKCNFAILQLPQFLPDHGFTSLPISTLVVRRITDEHLDQVALAANIEQLRQLAGKVSGNIILPSDDSGYNEIAKHVGSEKVLSYGTSDRAEARIEGVKMHPKGCEINLSFDTQTRISLTCKLTTKQAIYSLTAAAAAAYMIHAPLETIEEGVFKLAVQPGAAEYVVTERPYQIVLDSSVSPSGVNEVLESIKHFAKNRIITVLSASLGQPTSWRGAVGEVAASHSGRVIVTDGDYLSTEAPESVRAQLLEGASRSAGDASIEEVPDRAEALEKAINIARRGDIIVVCGYSARQYRQHGEKRKKWSDKKVFEDLL